MSTVFLYSLIGGVVIGIIPALSGVKKGQLGLAIGGFVCCIAGSILGGLILSIPLCVFFMHLISKNAVSNTTTSNNRAHQNPASNSDIDAQLKKLSELKSAGMLSDDEFKVKKALLLEKTK